MWQKYTLGYLPGCISVRSNNIKRKGLITPDSVLSLKMIWYHENWNDGLAFLIATLCYCDFQKAGTLFFFFKQIEPLIFCYREGVMNEFTISNLDNLCQIINPSTILTLIKMSLKDW